MLDLSETLLNCRCQLIWVHNTQWITVIRLGHILIFRLHIQINNVYRFYKIYQKLTYSVLDMYPNYLILPTYSVPNQNLRNSCTVWNISFCISCSLLALVWVIYYMIWKEYKNPGWISRPGENTQKKFWKKKK